MAKENIDPRQVKVSVPPPLDAPIKQVEEIFIVITQAFCHNGHPLMDEGKSDFDGYPGIRVYLKGPDKSGVAILSPFHGDPSKKTDLAWQVGTKLEICCPECREPFPRMASCLCEGGGDLVKFYTTPSLSDHYIVAMCNVWGCRRSRTINNWQIISEYLEGRIED